MIDVKEVLKVGKDVTVLVCTMFADEEIKDTIESNVGKHTKFNVETPKYCFSTPTTRNIVLYDNGKYDAIKSIQFV